MHNRYSSRVPSGENLAVDDEVRWLRAAGVDVRGPRGDERRHGRPRRARAAARWRRRRVVAARPAPVRRRARHGGAGPRPRPQPVPAPVGQRPRRRPPARPARRVDRAQPARPLRRRRQLPRRPPLPRLPARLAGARRGPRLLRRLGAGQRAGDGGQHPVPGLGPARRRPAGGGERDDAPVDRGRGRVPARWRAGQAQRCRRPRRRRAAPRRPRGRSCSSGASAAYKGLGLLLDAWAQAGVDAELRLVGDGDEAPAVEAAAAADPRIRWVGPVAPGDVGEHLAAARAVVVPSLWSEPFGRVAAEAFAHGRPVITTGLGGLGETVDAATGWVTGTDPAALAAALRDAAGDDAAVAERGEAARARWAERYSPEATTAALAARLRRGPGGLTCGCSSSTTPTRPGCRRARTCRWPTRSPGCARPASTWRSTRSATTPSWSAGVAGRARQAAETPWSVPAGRRFAAELARVRPDVVHVHNLFPLLTASVPQAALRADVPVVWTCRNRRVVCVEGANFRDGAPCHDCRPGWRVPGRSPRLLPAHPGGQRHDGTGRRGGGERPRDGGVVAVGPHRPAPGAGRGHRRGGAAVAGRRGRVPARAGGGEVRRRPRPGARDRRCRRPPPAARSSSPASSPTTRGCRCCSTPGGRAPPRTPRCASSATAPTPAWPRTQRRPTPASPSWGRCRRRPSPERWPEPGPWWSRRSRPRRSAAPRPRPSPTADRS